MYFLARVGYQPTVIVYHAARDIDKRQYVKVEKLSSRVVKAILEKLVISLYASLHLAFT